ncbi:RNA-binding S4 domain-containing protein [Rhizobium sp. LCM 4573]|uniref:RNA-binding S4 domain-containing protein n=1 Tax=Rhizobium sp. LCM 4573 TaxID=1848291 RepID=UPI0008DAAFD2|nr:RNA-binding S4 domain-containing protein [Rhizobium sp. LCM 4573]OHV82207.1 RNA-binding protein [Rhizobium sp. LCM 4573]
MSEKEPQQDSRQRIDKWLFFARMVKSRSLAQSLISAGAVTINGEICDQPSRMVKPGDRIEMLLDRRDLVLVVRAPGARRGPFEEAKLLYDDVTPPDRQKPLTPFERAQRGPASKSFRR